MRRERSKAPAGYGRTALRREVETHVRGSFSLPSRRSAKANAHRWDIRENNLLPRQPITPWAAGAGRGSESRPGRPGQPHQKRCGAAGSAHQDPAVLAQRQCANDAKEGDAERRRRRLEACVAPLEPVVGDGRAG